jgi:hypothetical protein
MADAVVLLVVLLFLLLLQLFTGGPGSARNNCMACAHLCSCLLPFVVFLRCRVTQLLVQSPLITSVRHA